MSFRDFAFPEVLPTLGLTLHHDYLFPNLVPVALRDEFQAVLTEGLELAQGINTEKARSEFIIAPLLVELRRAAPRRFGLFSGIEHNIDSSKGLNGICDFLLARDPMPYLLTAPVLAIVAAKNDNVWTGFGQCVATMYAAVRFNEKSGVSDQQMYGVCKTGTHWKFFHLVGPIVTVDRDEYFIDKPDGLLAALLRIVG